MAHASQLQSSGESRPSNEYVLNIAFLSFLAFTALQFVFAFIAKSQSMVTDCAAMTVDVVSYFVNYLAEKLKAGRQERTMLYLELFPPVFSVITLVIVTGVALHQAITTLSNPNLSLQDPNIGLMMLFSSLNLVLDFFNVGCFARTEFEPLTGQALSKQTAVAYGAAIDCTTTIPRTKPQAATNECTKLLGMLNPDDDEGPSSIVIRNLNMCSAWTHVCADTLRSIAVLIAAGTATMFPSQVSPVSADSNATIVVSIVILISLGPLLHGLYRTALRIIWLERAIQDMDLV